MAEAAAIPSFGGYDEEFVNAVEEDFLCPICQLPLKEAVQTSVCGHRFCRQCLDGHFMRLEYRLYLVLGFCLSLSLYEGGYSTTFSLIRSRSVSIGFKIQCNPIKVILRQSKVLAIL